MDIMYTAVYKKIGKYYCGWVLEVPGANSQATTKKELEANLKEAIELVLEAREEYLRKELGGSKITKLPLMLAS
jgi:predicted RNase H-like HicB family nuclease